MAEIKMGSVYRVDIIESERGWGRKVDEQKFFDNYEEAESFMEKYNADLPPGPAPDWYMQAEGPYKVN
jgi:hypothetical protein